MKNWIPDNLDQVKELDDSSRDIFKDKFKQNDLGIQSVLTKLDYRLQILKNTNGKDVKIW